MKLCFTGDAIALSHPKKEYWENNVLLEEIRECEIRGTNLEMVLSGGESFASTFCGGYWMTADADRLEILEKFHFNHYAMANNHTMDYSYKGLECTSRLLDSKNLLHSGAGKDLDSASRAEYLHCEDGVVAFITCTASCDDAARAGRASKTIPARPGVNMLRHSERIFVTSEQLKVIDEIAEQTCINARFLKAVRMGIHSLPKEIHRLGRIEFVEGEKTQKRTSCHKGDLSRIINEIRKAQKKTSNIIVSIHSHDIKGMTDDTPDEYVEEFARACIDAGATAIIGTGTHQLKAIEVYKGKPIFYSLGNFMFVSEHMDYAPSDYYERYGEDLQTDLDDIWLKRSKNNTVGLEFDAANYLSIVPILTIEENKLIKVELLPIELGFVGGDRQKGFPYVADCRQREQIFSRIKELSKEYGTVIENSNDKMVIKL